MKKVSTLPNKLLTQALQYLLIDRFSVIPCGKDKKPLLKSWKEFQSRRPTEDEIQEWWKKWPEANIGIVTGKLSGITVVDIDSYAGATDIFPPTFTVKTGNGGTQKFYKYQDGITISASAFKNMPHVDLRGEGGFVVAPPSITKYIDEKTGQERGGKYEILEFNNGEFAPFPIHLFTDEKGNIKKTKTLGEQISVDKGSRNTNLASFTGALLLAHKKESKWETDVWPAVERVNETYKPPLPKEEARAVFESICKKERERREQKLVISPIQIPTTNEEKPQEELKLRRNKQGVVIKDMSNALIVLEEHPLFKGSLRFNTFSNSVEYNGKELEDIDILNITHFMQTNMEMSGISKDVIYDAIISCAYENKYDELQDWLLSLKWDGVKRLDNWLATTCCLENDEYHKGVGSEWMMGLIRRIMEPGCSFNHALVLTGEQQIGKSYFFSIVGGKYYKMYAGGLETKDFYMTLRGAMVLDLDEGMTLYKSEIMKGKSVISATYDEFRAPYDRTMKKYPRRFVFGMTTNDDEPFKDLTGNERFWIVDLPPKRELPLIEVRKGEFKNLIRVDWLKENREQLFAETYYYYKNKIDINIIPAEIARQKQEDHLPQDIWTDAVVEYVLRQPGYLSADVDFSVAIGDVYKQIFPDRDLSQMHRGHEMRIAGILRRSLGLEKRQIMKEGIRKNRYFICEKTLKRLRENYDKGIIQDELRLEDF